MVLIQRRNGSMTTVCKTSAVATFSKEAASAIASDYFEPETAAIFENRDCFDEKKRRHLIVRLPLWICKLLICLILSLITFVSLHRNGTFTTVATKKRLIATTTKSYDDSCSDQKHLEWRMSQAFDENGRSTEYLSGLHGVIDNVLSPDEAARLVKLVAPFYKKQYEKNQYRPSPLEYFSPLQGMHKLSKELSVDDYTFLVGVRHRIRNMVQKRLKLCHLYLQLTAFRSKRLYDKELNVHADSCTLLLNATETKVAGCTSSQTPHRGIRMTGSVLFLNSIPEGGGGEFFLGDQETGKPYVVVPGKPGRLVYFTSGPECAHGALPVRNESVTRLSMAMWYHMKEELGVEQEEFDPNEVVCEDTFGGCGKFIGNPKKSVEA
mmetsp:Transcript_6547/g.7131  ORF Transcript_6547/g.7131 Transcript_6547/m.7131 type:complete len:379 (+) Transcript_6547:78-1214(+)|eukprot:CAMPEP_0194154516 /NCGR_PEP_ID=MMETSP0152-20130528/60991_1 /TAXON_ID=1049557 /ORGANISM="Thalassiothrix antarctica, Strain L6-D1" /LENGTH=378 /DNA_ID=CAMNT_0038860683 /DNA_START=35 /DNA_END=1171 /DNA_ORIENTATION=+